MHGIDQELAGVVELLSPFLPIRLPAAGLKPYLVGLVTGFVCLMAFALPPILRLRAVSPIRVLRRDLSDGNARDLLPWLSGVAGNCWPYSRTVRSRQVHNK